MSIEAMKLAAEFNRYFTSGNGVDVPAKVSVSRDEWRALFTAIQQAEAQQPATGEPVAWSEREQLRHAQAAVVMPMIGPLLDAWENSDREVMSQEPELSKQLKNINSAMEDADTHPAPSVPDGWRRASDLPPPGHPVIAWVDGVKVPIRAFWVPDFHLEPGDDFDTEWAKYSEEHDTFFCPSGWYESNHYEETNWQVEKPVLAWMPLPAIDAAMLAAKDASA